MKVTFITQSRSMARSQEAGVARALMPLLSDLQEANYARHEAQQARKRPPESAR